MAKKETQSKSTKRPVTSLRSTENQVTAKEMLTEFHKLVEHLQSLYADHLLQGDNLKANPTDNILIQVYRESRFNCIEDLEQIIDTAITKIETLAAKGGKSITDDTKNNIRKFLETFDEWQKNGPVPPHPNAPAPSASN